MIARIETARLVGLPIAHADLDDLLTLHRDPAVMATLGGRLWDEANNLAFLDRMLAQWDRSGYGVWTWRLREDGRFAGRAGLNHKQIDGVDETELLYAVRSDLWGRGLATEAARAIADLAFERLTRRDLVAFTLPSNLGSRRVMEKAGFVYERNIIHAGLPHVLCRCRADKQAPST